MECKKLVPTFPVRVRKYAPQPRIPADPMARTIAHGTAVAAFEASSLMWTLESKEPESQSVASGHAGQRSFPIRTNSPQRRQEAQNKGITRRPSVHFDHNQHDRSESFKRRRTVCKVTQCEASAVHELFGCRGRQGYDDSKTKPEMTFRIEMRTMGIRMHTHRTFRTT